MGFRRQMRATRVEFVLQDQSMTCLRLQALLSRPAYVSSMCVHIARADTHTHIHVCILYLSIQTCFAHMCEWQWGLATCQ